MFHHFSAAKLQNAQLKLFSGWRLTCSAAAIHSALFVTTFACGATPETDKADKQALILSSSTQQNHPSLAKLRSYPVVTEEIIVNGDFRDRLEPWNIGRQSTARLIAKNPQASIEIDGSLIQKFPAGTFIPGRSYRLLVATNEKSSANWNAVVRFREPKSGNGFRSYFVKPGSDSNSESFVDFTAPAYTALAEIEISAVGAKTFERVSVKMRDPLQNTQPVNDWSFSFTPEGYELAFNDEFDGNELNRRKWFTRYISGGETLDRLNDEKQRYRDNWNHVVDKGILNLVARRKPLNDPNGIDYESGVIRSDWTFRYGFLEARVRMPPGRGVWPAFWLLSDVDESGRINWPPEIDIFEYAYNEFDDRSNKVHMAANTPKGMQHQYVYTAPGFKKETQDWVASHDFNKGWHTLAVEWKPDLLNFFVDGQKVAGRTHRWTFADDSIAGPAHILLNLAIGGAWAGRYGIDNAAFPQALEIDWVRAYQKPSQ